MCRTMASAVKFVFSKCFFAEYLCVSVDKVSFAVMRYVDEEDSFERLVIKVKGIDRWFFDIETRNFIRLSANHTLIPAKIRKNRDIVIFSTNDGAEVNYDLDNFRKYYMRRIVSSLIKDAPPSAQEVPTIRKNKWEEKHRVLLLEFNKRFWSKLLHINPREIACGLIRAKYYIADEPDILKYIDLVPVLKINGVSDYYFNIEHGMFFKPEEYNGEFSKYWCGIFHTEYVPTKIVCSRDKVVFFTKEGERAELYKANIYRHYMTMVVNNAIL